MLSNRVKDNRALALVVAIVILVTLTVIAVPFVVSMLYKEKITKNTFYQTQTRFKALSARNHAVPLLLHSHSFYERQAQFPAPFETPDYDILEESNPTDAHRHDLHPILNVRLLHHQHFEQRPNVSTKHIF